MAFQDDTVFVIGAGASAEFGLPVGWQLLKDIRDNSFFEFQPSHTRPKGTDKIFQTVVEKYNDDRRELDEVFLAFRRIHQAVETAGSIDEYINRYSDNTLIAELGKIQIAYSILQAESKSKLIPIRGRDGDGVNWEEADNTWIAPFTRALFDGVRAKDVENLGSNITIICFNYDRCIEHYLEYAIARAYHDVDRKTARQIVKNINIIHPYGSLGPLDSLSFAAPVERADLHRVIKNLITWSETVEDDNLIASIGRSIREAKKIVFLGFAFANQNMRLLSMNWPEDKPYITDVYATGKGFTDDVDETIKRKIYATYSASGRLSQAEAQRIKIKYDMVCKEFMDKQLMNFTI